MSDLDKAIKVHIESFVEELTNLVKRTVLANVEAQLGVHQRAAATKTVATHAPAALSRTAPTGKKRGRPSNAEKAARLAAEGGAAAPAKQAKAPKAPKAGKRVRRDTADIDATADGILSWLGKNVDSGIEAIAKGMGRTSKDLTLPMRKLLDEKKVKKKGERRGTTYHV